MIKTTTQLLAFLTLTLCLASPAGLQAQITDLATFNGTNGQSAEAGLILSPDGTTLYGTTANGGANGDGVIFSVPVTGGAPTVLASFSGANGANPQSELLLSGGTLYGTTATGGANNDGVVFSLPVGGGTPTILTSFNGANGQRPVAGLVLSGGTLYGTTVVGGASNDGVVFSLPAGGGTPTVLTSFNGANGQAPTPGRLVLSGNTFYGTTKTGGANGDGVVFSLSISGGTPTVLTSFNGTNGNQPLNGLLLSGSTLYGTTGYGGVEGFGNVFSLPVSGGTPTVLLDFNHTNGQTPSAGLLLSPDGNTLYGSTLFGGTNGDGEVFSLPVSGGTPAVASFDAANGDEPVGGLVLSGDTIYGVTTSGGANGDGVVFSTPEPGSAGLLLTGTLAMVARRRRRIQPRSTQRHFPMTKTATRLFAFLTLCLAATASLQAQITDLTSFNGANSSNGEFPEAGLVLSQDGSTLYGTTADGGTYGYGVVFSVPVGGGAPTVLANFNGSNGQTPAASLVLSKDGSTLYGTTNAGGTNGDGVVFSLPVSGGTPTVLTSFNGTNGRIPAAGLTLNGGILYGTTYVGGANGDGEVFSLPVTGGTPTVLTSFNGTNGQLPTTGRLVLIGNTLYGTTQNGGTNGDGVVFSVPLGGGTPTVLASFNGSNGRNLTSGLVLSRDGSTLYGAAGHGTPNDGGVIYALSIDGGTPTILAGFSVSNGENPTAGLVLSQDGSTLYGTTSYGGTSDDGVVFSVPIDGGTPAVLASLDGVNGARPIGELLLSGDTLYGVALGDGSDGANGDGVVFSVPASVPEPGSVGLLLSGTLATMVRRRAQSIT